MLRNWHISDIPALHERAQGEQCPVLLHGLIPLHPITHTVVTEGTLATVKIVQGVETGLGKIRRPDEVQIKMRNYEMGKISNLMKLTVHCANEASLSASDLKSRNGQEMVQNCQEMVQICQEMVKNGQEMVQDGQEMVQSGQEMVQNGQEMDQDGQEMVQDGQEMSRNVRL